MPSRDAAARARQARIRELQQQGYRGGRIAPHRAMIGLPLSWRLVMDVLVYPAIVLVVLALLRDPITDVWRRFFEAMAGPLGLPGGVVTGEWKLGPLEVRLPAFASVAAWPKLPGLLLGWLVTVMLALCGLLLRGPLVPFGYLLRAMAVVQLTAQLWFTFAKGPEFTYTLQGYQEAVFYLGTVVIFLVPVGTAFTFNIFDFRPWQKLVLTGMIVAHLLVLLPMQVATHAYIIHRMTLLAMPMLYLLFGILLDVFVFVALYGWGMSWRSGGELDASDRRPPRPAPPSPPDGDPVAPGTGDPEIGRRAQAARDAAALAAALTGRGVPRPAAPVTASAAAAPSSTAPAAPVPAAPAPAAPAPLPPWPTQSPAAAAPGTSRPAPSSTPAAGTGAVPSPTPAAGTGTVASPTPAVGGPRVVPPRSTRAVPLVFGKGAGAAPPARKPSR